MEIAGLTLHSIIKTKGHNLQTQQDILAVEEPLQIQLQLNTATGRIQKNIAITMRTPGNDNELAAGFLFTEGIINNRQQIAGIWHVHNDENNVLIALKDDAVPALQNSERNFYTSSSCGVCGKASIDAVKTTSIFNDAVHFTIAIDILYTLQNELIKQQQLFESTGGLHAAALFDVNGKFELLKEDVGRHNALDKLIGNFFLQDALPLYNKILLLSGRASFELIQKAAMAGIKMIAAIGAPSSMAVELATENDITLVGFLRHNSMNIYCGNQRIK
jgi:FdhD protein